MRQTTKSKPAYSSKRTRGRKQPIRLKIESMEDRTVPAIVPVIDVPPALLPTGHAIVGDGLNSTAMLGNTLVFASAQPGGTAAELWTTDGTSENTHPLDEALGGLSPTEVVAANNLIIFAADDTSVAGTATNLYSWGTNKENPSTPLTNFTGGSISHLRSAGNIVYFAYNDPTAPANMPITQLWKTDGTVAGTQRIVNFNTEKGYAADFATSEAIDGKLYLRCRTSAGDQLWVSDGTINGTKPIAGAMPVGTTLDAVASGGVLFFTATDGTGAKHLYSTNGTSVTDLRATGVKNLTEGAGGIVVFTATGDHGTIIGMSDGSVQGTVPLVDSSRFPTTMNRDTIGNMTVARSIVYFTANEASTGNELWMAQGNIVSLVADVAPGTASSNPVALESAAETLYFAATDPTRGTEIFATDGTTRGTGIAADIAPGAVSSMPDAVHIVNGHVLVDATAATPAEGVAADQLFALDGTATNPIREEPAAGRYTVSIAASSPSVSFGQGVTITVQVSPQAGSSAATGRVQIFNGAGVQVGSAAITPAGNAVWSPSTALAGGAHKFQAVYTPDNISFVSQQVAVTVNKLATTTAIAASATSVVMNTPITFTATIGGSDLGKSGTVTFRAGSTVIGTAPVANGKATLTVSNLTEGTYNVMATYEGSSALLSSSSPAAQVMVTSDRILTRTWLNIPANATPGQAVTFGARAASGLGYYPTGTITFFDGTTELGTATMNAEQIAYLTLPNGLSAGVHSITARYNGAAEFLPSSTGVASTIDVKPDQVASRIVASATRLSPTTITTMANQNVVLTATVTAATGGAKANGGTVTFKDGATILGKATVTNGVASLSASFATRGVHAVTANFDGGSGMGTSLSRASYVTVRGWDARTTLTVDGRSGQATLTAVVAPRDVASGQASGKVMFYDGQTLLGQANVVNGKATWSGTTGYGARTFRAVFQSNGSFNDNSSPSVYYSIRYPVSIVLIAPLPSVNDFALFKVTVTPLSPGAPAANGRVTFMEGTTNLGTVPVVNGVAQLLVGSNGRSYRNFQAVYQGGELFESGSPTPVIYGTPTGTADDRIAPMPPVKQVNAPTVPPVK